jgi:hypothetical protein
VWLFSHKVERCNTLDLLMQNPRCPNLWGFFGGANVTALEEAEEAEAEAEEAEVEEAEAEEESTSVQPLEWSRSL